MIERCTELAREWNIPVFIAHLDLKKAFERISHDSIAAFAVGGAAVLWKSVWDM